MRYVSNLTAPDLRKHFKLCDPIRQHGTHDAPSDPDYEPDCLYWSDDEAAILYTVAKSVADGNWIDVGSRFGWSAAHVAAAGHEVGMVDPHLAIRERNARCQANIQPWGRLITDSWHTTWRDLACHLRGNETNWDGFTIDGNHNAPEPLLDVQDAASLACRNCIIMLHDGYGDPVREAAKWLMANGWKARFYWTPNGVICAWRGDGFTPPDHVRDPAIDWAGYEKLVYADIPKGEWA